MATNSKPQKRALVYRPASTSTEQAGEIRTTPIRMLRRKQQRLSNILDVIDQAEDTPRGSIYMVVVQPDGSTKHVDVTRTVADAVGWLHESIDTYFVSLRLAAELIAQEEKDGGQ